MHVHYMLDMHTCFVATVCVVQFFTQTTLKALFPDAAGKRSAERTIPQLPS